MITELSRSELETTAAGVIIAGGKGSRLGYVDKPLLPIGRKTLLQWIIDNAGHQVHPLLLNINVNQLAFSAYGLTQLDDGEFPHAGPLAGVFAGLLWVQQQHPEVRWLACFPGDTPWFPSDTVQRLMRQVLDSQARIAWLQTDGQLQPLFSLWSLDLLEDLRSALQNGEYSPRHFIESQPSALVQLTGLHPDMFLNINDEVTLANARAAGSAEQQ